MPRIRLPWLALILALASPVTAATLPGFYNTGVDETRAVLATGAVDPHYVLISSADGAHPGPSAFACSPIPGGYWYPNNSLSRWIAPAVNEDWPALGTPHPAGSYVYRVSFDLTGYDTTSVAVSGRCGMDNYGSLRLNGVAVGVPIPSYAPLTPFTLSGGFVSGVNHLDFVVVNLAASGANPTGLRVEDLTATATPVTAVGEPLRRGEFLVLAIRPLPSRDRADIAFDLPRAGRVSVRIRDVAGRLMSTLADRDFPPGRSEVVWRGERVGNGHAGPGVYFAEVEFEGTRLARRVLWIP